MNKFVTIGLGAAAVVVALLVGAQLIGSPNGGVGAQPTSSATPEPTPNPTPSLAADAGLPEGPHMILTGQDDEGAVIMPPLTVMIPGAGWSGEVGSGILSKNEDSPPPDFMGMIVFAGPEYIVYGDACRWETTQTPVTTVDEFVAALSAQGSRDASEAVDITLDGHAGKSITLSVPDDVDVAECDPGYGGSWDCGGDGTMMPCGYHGGPDAIDVVYILDIDGLIVAWETWHYTGTSAEDVTEMEAVVQSATFGE